MSWARIQLQQGHRCGDVDGETIRHIIEHGMGSGIKAIWNARSNPESGRLVEVLSDFPLVAENATWALCLSNRIGAPNVRATGFLVSY